ncbi:MAG: MMPL family transporter, partial [Oscillospiraceae bacterium]|nr:MMPL family transporter [Oscillospiraceae bacterium]
QGAIWINFSIPVFTKVDIFFIAYLIVSAIQMGANIDYAIVIASRYMDLKDEMHPKDAIIETMNFAFPTIITSGIILAASGFILGNISSEGTIVGIGESLGRGTLISIILVMFALPQILIIGGKVIERTSFSVGGAIRRRSKSGRMLVDGVVHGRINGTVSGLIRGTVEGDVNLTFISGGVEGDENEE